MPDLAKYINYRGNMMRTWITMSLLLPFLGASYIASYDIRYRRSVETESSLSDVYLSCEEGWFNFDDFCYKRFGENKTEWMYWMQASDECRRYNGGNLVTIDSKELQDFLMAFLMLSARAPVWIGLNDLRIESRYEWKDGTLVNYTNWAPNEPSGKKHSSHEDCTELRPFPWMNTGKIGHWNDVGCVNRFQYVCQKKKGRRNEMSPDPRFCSPEEGGGWKFESSCFHLVKEPMDWSEAEQYCVQYHKGHLASIVDFAVHSYLSYVFQEDLESWVGLKINPNEEQQKWSSGWFAVYQDWEDSEKAPPIGCAVFVPNGKWSYKSCTKYLPFICERSSVVPATLKPGPEGSFCPKQPKGWRDLGGDRCYFFNTTAEETWQDANFLCMRKGGTLASVHSIEEINVLQNFLRFDASEKFHEIYIGLYRREPDGKFVWADGSDVDFKYWAPGEDSSVKEHCVEVQRYSLHWNDIQCSNKRGYFCTAPKIRGNTTTTDVAETADKLTDSNRFSAGSMVGVVVCVLCVAILLSIVVYHFRLCDRGAEQFRKYHGKGTTAQTERRNTCGLSEFLVRENNETVDYEVMKSEQ